MYNIWSYPYRTGAWVLLVFVGSLEMINVMACIQYEGDTSTDAYTPLKHYNIFAYD